MKTRKRLPCVLCAVVLCAAAAVAHAQKSHDALFRARAKAKSENQTVLLLIRGGDANVDAALGKAISNYRQLGKLIRYEYQLAALPSSSLAAKHLRKTLGLGERSLPILAALGIDDEGEDRLLAAMDSKAMAPDAEFRLQRVRGFLESHARPQLDARKVLAAGFREARKSKRQVFVYLSAPW